MSAEATYPLTEAEVAVLRAWAKKVADLQSALETAQQELHALQRCVASRCPAPIRDLDLARGVFVLQPAPDATPPPAP